MRSGLYILQNKVREFPLFKHEKQNLRLNVVVDMIGCVHMDGGESAIFPALAGTNKIHKH
jgi:hypothetical protein